MTAAPRRILVVVTRRIGDVLLATPLIRSLAQAWRQVRIDALVFEGTQGVLAGNPDLAQVLTVPERPTFAQHARLFAALCRRYDLALSLIPGDRPTLYAYVAGRRRIGLLIDRAKDAWKRRLLHDWVPFDDLDTHTVRMHLALATRLGIAPTGDVAVHWTPDDERAVSALLGDDARPLAVLHVYPKFTYKQWPAAHWQSLARDLAQRGWRLALTGSRDVDERAYIDELARAARRHRQCGRPPDAGRISLSRQSRVLLCRHGHRHDARGRRARCTDRRTVRSVQSGEMGAVAARTGRRGESLGEMRHAAPR